MDLVKGKYEFWFEIITDGVSATALFLRPSKMQAAISDDELFERYMHDEFEYEISIDPGMRTYIAALQRNIKTQEEVIELTFNQFGKT